MSEAKREFTIDEQLAIMNLSENGRDSDSDTTRNPLTGRLVGEESLNVTFTLEPVYSKVETFLAGGVPKYVDREFITITIPNNQTLSIHAMVEESHKFRFPHEYAAFKSGQEAVVTGTPLSMWAVISPSQAKDFEARGIRTVEQVAGLADNSASIPGLQQLKVKARQFLEVSKDKAATGVLQAQLDQRDQDMAAMKAQLDQLTALLLAQQAAKAEPETEAPTAKAKK